MDFSVIIPIYNSQNYIVRCLDSVFLEDGCSFEVVVVNDGSTDQSRAIIRRYENKFSNLKVIDKSNSGVSSARNRGLIASSGEYVVFVDSDDWVEPGYLSFLRGQLFAGDYDGIVLNYYLDHGCGMIIKSDYTNNIETDITGFEYGKLFLQGAITNSPCNKVFKRSIYIDNSIFFPENISMGEDAITMARLSLVANKIKLHPSAFLHYMQDSGGVTKSKPSMDNLKDVIAAMRAIDLNYESVFPRKKIDQLIFKQLYYYYLNVRFNELLREKKALAYYTGIISRLSVIDFTSIKWKLRYFLIGVFNSRYSILFLNLVYSNFKKFKFW